MSQQFVGNHIAQFLRECWIFFSKDQDVTVILALIFSHLWHLIDQKLPREIEPPGNQCMEISRKFLWERNFGKDFGITPFEYIQGETSLPFSLDKEKQEKGYLPLSLLHDFPYNN